METITTDGVHILPVGGICAPQGFRANGCYAGIKASASKRPDLALVKADTLCNAAAVYTRNQVQGAHIPVMREHLQATGGKASAVLINSKNANACVKDGPSKAAALCAVTANQLEVSPDEVLAMSTGVIGQSLPLEPVEDALPELCAGLTADAEGAHKAATAIMTTDTFAKECAVEIEVDGKACRIGGMAKGSGMIHPNMGTTLSVLTTDIAMEPALLEETLRQVVDVTLNCLSIDGDQSTNDTCLVLASGASGVTLTADSPGYTLFRTALCVVLTNLTRMLARDGEGASKLLTCTVVGARTQADAIAVAKNVIDSNLLKCAIFGEDANWGRVLCAIGNAPVQVDQDKISVTLQSKAGEILVCENGMGVDFSEEKAATILKEEEIRVLVDLHEGEARGTAWGCDLTYSYVKINGDYRT